MQDQQGFILQIVFCLLFAAIVAVLNILSAFTSQNKKVTYSVFTIFFMLFSAGLLSDWLQQYIYISNFFDTILTFIFAVLTVAIVFMKERTMKTIGLSTEGLVKSLLIGLAAGLVECFFWGNINPRGEGGVTAIEAGEVVLMAPLVEEVFFRGFLLRFFQLKNYSVFKSIVLSSLIWTAIHFYSFNASAVLFLSGLLLGYIRVKTKSVVAPIIMHSVWNFFVL